MASVDRHVSHLRRWYTSAYTLLISNFPLAFHILVFFIFCLNLAVYSVEIRIVAGPKGVPAVILDFVICSETWASSRLLRHAVLNNQMQDLPQHSSLDVLISSIRDVFNQLLPGFVALFKIKVPYLLLLFLLARLRHEIELQLAFNQFVDVTHVYGVLAYLTLLLFRYQRWFAKLRF